MNHIDLMDIPRSYTAIAEWGACLLAIYMMPKRYSLKQLVPISGAALLIQIGVLVLTDDVPVMFWIPCMLLAVAFMYLFLYICCDTTLLTIGYYCANAFILAEFAASLEWQVYYFFFVRMGHGSVKISLLTMIFVYSVVFVIMWMLEDKFTSQMRLTISKYECLAAVLIVGLSFAFSNLGYLYADTSFGEQISDNIFYTRTLVDLCGLAVTYSYYMRIQELRLENEMAVIRMTLENQYEQYKRYQESIDIINYKYHDIKHQIEGLRSLDSSKAKNEWLDNMEHDLRQYEETINTGNAVLDTLLTSKNIVCRKNHIGLTCVIDGTLLDFMSSMDLCSIFGNALDNAIESVVKLENPEERLIHVSLSTQKGFVLILFENYCRETLNFEKGMPKTTKADNKNHGFGIKSIQYTVKKYDGTVTVACNKNWFELKILIPKK